MFPCTLGLAHPLLRMAAGKPRHGRWDPRCCPCSRATVRLVKAIPILGVENCELDKARNEFVHRATFCPFGRQAGRQACTHQAQHRARLPDSTHILVLHLQLDLASGNGLSTGPSRKQTAGTPLPKSGQEGRGSTGLPRLLINTVP